MAFSDISNAQALTGTTLDSTAIGVLRDMADIAITDVLEANSLNVPTDVPKSLEMASTMWTCRNIKMREQSDGSSPNVFRAGNFFKVTGVEKAITDYDARGWAALRRFMNGQLDTNMFATTE